METYYKKRPEIVKACVARYQASEKGKAKVKECIQRYQQSEKGKEARQRYLDKHREEINAKKREYMRKKRAM